jgi:hypothetical protein
VLASWLLLWLAGTLAVVVEWTPVTVPRWLPQAGAAAISTLLAFALTTRSGGRPVVGGGVALALAVAAVVTGEPILLASAAIGTAVLGAVLGVMSTTPAARMPAVVRECALAVLVAVVTAFAVNAYHPEVSLERSGYTVLALALLGALALAYRLAAGLHGLGRRGALMLVGGLVLLSVSLAYTEALSRWASPDLVDAFAGAAGEVRDRIGAVPRPTLFLLGVPALAWGVSTRARRRQGWWGTGLGAAGLATVTTTLLDPDLPLIEAGLGVLYSVAAGLVLGYLLIRADRFVSGARGPLARALEEAAAHRPEPGRFQPLM